MKLYKVLNKDLTSPYLRFKFELGKKYVCNNFDTSNKECSNGFYAVDFNGLVYAINTYGVKHSVFEVEVGGLSKEFNQFKRRYEEITIIRELTDDEIKEGLLACEKSEGYKTYEACYPINPLAIEPSISVEDALVLLKKWSSVRAFVWYSARDSVWNSVWAYVRDFVWVSIRDSVRDSVWTSVWASVRASAWDSVRDSVEDSVWEAVRDSVWDIMCAYFSSLFPNIKKWHGVKHEIGINPFQSGIALCKAGYVPSFDGKVWRLHTKNGIVWEGTLC